MNIGAALSGLGGVYPGMMQGETSALQLDQLRNQEIAQAARWNALQSLFGGGLPGGGPQGAMAMPPGAASQPAQPSTDVRPGGGPPAGSPVPIGPQAPAIGGQPQPAQPMTAQLRSGQPGQSVGSISGQPVYPSGPRGPQDQGGQPEGSLDWRSVVMSLARANPGIKPEALAMAVDQFVPMMTSQAKTEWQALKLQSEREKQDEISKRQQEGLAYKRERDAQNEEIARLNRESRDNRALQANALREQELDLRKLINSGKLSTAEQQDATRRLAINQRDQASIRAADVAAANRESRENISTERTQTQLDIAAGAQEGQRLRTQTQADVNRERIQAQKDIAAGKPTPKHVMDTINQQNTFDSVDNSITNLSRLIEQARAEGMSGVGAFGKAQRLGEIITSMPGWSNRTLANQIEQNINILKRQVGPLLDPKMRYSTAADRATMDEIVKGLGLGSTSPITLDALQNVQRILRSMRPVSDPRMEGRLPQGPATQERNQRTQLQPMDAETAALFDKAMALPNADRATIEKGFRDRGWDPGARQ